ncbi:MAG TPA: hypothetical protein VGO96_06830 [Pyrinomonadaceae bacterium]|jgi:hypothetical protein|nr:hypothetical protein [Pyrinomonadaceae bacterium]
MHITHIKKGALLLFALAGVLTQAIPTARTSSPPPPQQFPPINVSSSKVPSDITPPASLQSAAIFAWQEFIALNWPAVPQTGQLNTRETPDTSKKFGDPNYNGPLVWHTTRGKVEIFPGTGNPPGYVNNAAQSYGYDAAPQYIYQPGSVASGGVGTPSGQVQPFNLTPRLIVRQPPWINLDENSEIGVTTMYAGNASGLPVPGTMILFMAKANRTEYNYVAANGWWSNSSSSRNNAITNTQTYVQTRKQDPPPGSSTYVSFPNGTIELKAAWRRLTPTEIKSKRFYMTRVRYYREKSNGAPGYVDDVFGLLALHIIQKTPSAPYFIYATFSQADNLLTANGQPVEDVNGKLLQNQTAPPTAPLVVSKNATSANPATPSSVQSFTPLVAPPQPQTKRLYYINTPVPPPATPTPIPWTQPNTQGKVSLNKRINDIPTDIIGVNQSAHAAIAAYNQSNGIANSPWLYYKLVNVQYQPYDKQPGITYTGAPGGPLASTYYQSNEVVESDYTLQVFSGQFQPQLPSPNQNFNTGNLITDYNTDGTVFKNVSYNGRGYLMGGCMGCHGNIQQKGFNFSFIFAGGNVPRPETTNPPTSLPKFFKLLAN